MNPPDHPTPRTDAAWSKTFEDELNQFWSGNAANKMRDECAKLERELAAAKAECEKLRADGRAGAFIDMSVRASTAETELTRLRADLERLKGALALGQQNCDDAYDDLREERDEAIARAEKAEAALAFIAENGGTKHETECGTISCNGLWCAEQARAAMKGTP
jgi:hypothetical protein